MFNCSNLVLGCVWVRGNRAVKSNVGMPPPPVQISTLAIKSVADCSISLKFVTEYDHITADNKRSRTKGQRSMSQRNVRYQQEKKVSNQKRIVDQLQTWYGPSKAGNYGLDDERTQVAMHCNCHHFQLNKFSRQSPAPVLTTKPQ